MVIILLLLFLGIIIYLIKNNEKFQPTFGCLEGRLSPCQGWPYPCRPERDILVIDDETRVPALNGWPGAPVLTPSLGLNPTATF